MTDSLFVYGTLAPGRPNAHVLEDVPGTWTPATLRGDLHEAGWGAADGFPAIIPRPDAEAVRGWVFASDALADHWQRLDDFEGEGYRRVQVDARLETGETVRTHVYALAQEPTA